MEMETITILKERRMQNERMISTAAKAHFSPYSVGGNMGIYYEETCQNPMAKGELPYSTITVTSATNKQRTTQIYLASLDSSVIDKANKLILKGL